MAIDSHSHFLNLSLDLTDVPPAQHRGLCRRRWWCAQYVHFALQLWLLRTPQLAVQPNGIVNTTVFDPYHPSIVLCVIRWIHEAMMIIGTTVVRTIASCNHLIMVMSTCQGSIPFALFAGGSYMLVAAAIGVKSVVLYRGVCGVGKYYVGQKP